MKPWARGVLALWGLALLGLLAVLAWFGSQAASQLGSRGYSGFVMQQCAPPDLPLPSGVAVKSINASVNSGGPGRACQADFDVPQSRDRTYGFFTSSLSRGRWSVAAADNETGHIDFGHTDGTAHGSIDITSGSGQNTHVKLEVRGNW